MEDNDSRSPPPSLSSQLLCQEIDTCLNEEAVVEVVDEETFTYSVSGIEEDEYVQILLDREVNVERESESSRISNGDWIKGARLDAITWILKTRALLGFRFQTAYLSVIYFDGFLSRRIIDSKKYWAIRLLSLACLSLAAKMEEIKVPALSEFRIEEYDFGSKVIRRMELLVLNTLEWMMSSVTPFGYIHYFITKLCKSHSPPKNLVPKIVQLILAMIREVNSMDHRPSVIAGAATFVALDRKLAKQAMEREINAFFPSGFLEIESLFSCYIRMQILEIGEVATPDSPFQLRGMEDIANSSLITALSTKRKRLTFSDCDQNSGIPDEKRQR